ncbi:uncharacterized protein LOC131693738 [Topomyia yanbarensis]|uniref:uncharacterized protein LOC131693738 n=1 Tax=Topomyia yanbarensis TaxID=2498891 RepID=UPI00273C76B3|nr:uncharacterized protein LOC131693738 [Topomyia yanbarensis]
MDPGYYKVTEDNPKIESSEEYHKLSGYLLYLSVSSRSDVAVAVGILSRKVSCPSMTDWTEAKGMVRYLIHTGDYGLTLGRSGRELLLSGYCNSDWAGDSRDQKCCTGYMFSLKGATVTWVSWKQSCVAMSTMEAKYVVLSEATREVVCLPRLLA